MDPFHQWHQANLAGWARRACRDTCAPGDRSEHSEICHSSKDLGAPVVKDMPGRSLHRRRQTVAFWIPTTWNKSQPLVSVLILEVTHSIYLGIQLCPYIGWAGRWWGRCSTSPGINIWRHGSTSSRATLCEDGIPSSRTGYIHWIRNLYMVLWTPLWRAHWFGYKSEPSSFPMTHPYNSGLYGVTGLVPQGRTITITVNI